MEWLLNPVNKGKYKRNVFVSYLLLSFLLYNSLGTFLGKALHRPAKVGVKWNNQNMESDIQTATQPCPLPVTFSPYTPQGLQKLENAKYDAHTISFQTFLYGYLKLS